MKTFAAIAFFAATALTQELSSLPECGQTCIQNMLDLAPELDCSDADASCLCEKIDFGYGVRDCSAQACPEDADLSSIDAYALEYCGDVAPTAAQGALTENPAVSDPSNAEPTDSDSDEDEETDEETDEESTTGEDPVAGGGIVTTIITDGMTMVTTLPATGNATDIEGEGGVGGAQPTDASETDAEGEGGNSTDPSMTMVGEDEPTETDSSEDSDDTSTGGSGTGGSDGSDDSDDSDSSDSDSTDSAEGGDAASTTQDDAAFPAATVAMHGVAGLAGLAALMAL